MERKEFDRLLTAALPEIEKAAQTYARKFLRWQEWQDVAQSACLRMLRFAHLYDPEKGPLLPWACVVIINILKNAAASPVHTEIQDNRALELTRNDITPDENVHMQFLRTLLNEEAQLYVDGYNYREIAARCGYRSKTTAMARIDSCADRLRHVLGLSAGRGRRKNTFGKNSA